MRVGRRGDTTWTPAKARRATATARRADADLEIPRLVHATQESVVVEEQEPAGRPLHHGERRERVVRDVRFDHGVERQVREHVRVVQEERVVEAEQVPARGAVRRPSRGAARSRGRARPRRRSRPARARSARSGPRRGARSPRRGRRRPGRGGGSPARASARRPRPPAPWAGGRCSGLSRVPRPAAKTSACITRPSGRRVRACAAQAPASACSSSHARRRGNRSCRCRARRSAKYTERCCPPVHPKWTSSDRNPRRR